MSSVHAASVTLLHTTSILSASTISVAMEVTKLYPKMGATFDLQLLFPESVVQRRLMRWERERKES